MKTKLILTFIIICSFLQLASAQQTFYYSGGSKVTLHLLEDMFSVTTFDNKQLKALEVGILPSLKLKELNKVSYRVSVFKSNNSKERKALLKELNALKEKGLIVQPCYKDKSGLELISGINLNVKLKQTQDLAVLKDYASKHNMLIAKQYEAMPLWYMLSIQSIKNGNVVEQANKMYETGLFASASPDFFFEAKESISALEEADLSQSKTLIFPNPVSECIIIRGASPNSKVVMTNLKGEKLFQAFCNAEGELKHSILIYPDGLYLLQIGRVVEKVYIKK